MSKPWRRFMCALQRDVSLQTAASRQIVALRGQAKRRQCDCSTYSEN